MIPTRVWLCVKNREFTVFSSNQLNINELMDFFRGAFHTILNYRTGKICI